MVNTSRVSIKILGPLWEFVDKIEARNEQQLLRGHLEEAISNPLVRDHFPGIDLWTHLSPARRRIDLLPRRLVLPLRRAGHRP